MTQSNMPGASRADTGGPDATVERWRKAESQLYPFAMSDPDLYEAAVTLVVEARDILRERCADRTAVGAIGADEVLRGCPHRSAVAEYGFDARIAVDAARAQRWRELEQR